MIIAGALWGFGFVATIWSLKAYTPQETLFWRFTIATLAGMILSLGLIKNSRTWKGDLRLALPAGVILMVLLILQTIGLQYTTATKSGFLTCLYVILVPIFHSVFGKKLPSITTWMWVLAALGGTYLLVGGNLGTLNQGDLWTIGSAFGSSAHIIYIGSISSRVKNSFLFNNFQSMWCLVALTPIWLYTKPAIQTTVGFLPIAGLLFLGLGASLVAFALQIRAQKALSDTTASMLFLLESPFAALFGYLLLSEWLDIPQTLGAVLIIAAATGQILTDKTKKISPN